MWDFAQKSSFTPVACVTVHTLIFTVVTALVCVKLRMNWRFNSSVISRRAGCLLLTFWELVTLAERVTTFFTSTAAHASHSPNGRLWTIGYVDAAVKHETCLSSTWFALSPVVVVDGDFAALRRSSSGVLPSLPARRHVCRGRQRAQTNNSFRIYS